MKLDNIKELVNKKIKDAVQEPMLERVKEKISLSEEVKGLTSKISPLIKEKIEKSILDATKEVIKREIREEMVPDLHSKVLNSLAGMVTDAVSDAVMKNVIPSVIDIAKKELLNENLILKIIKEVFKKSE